MADQAVKKDAEAVVKEMPQAMGLTADVLVEALERLEQRRKTGDRSPIEPLLTEEILPLGEGKVFTIDKVDRTISPNDRILG